MSFILEALKKSDKERRHGTQPDVFSPDIEPPSFSATRHNGWLMVLISAVTIGLVASVTLYFSYTPMRQQENTGAPEPTTRQVEHSPPTPPANSQQATVKDERVAIEPVANQGLKTSQPAEQEGPTVMSSAVQYLEAEEKKIQYLQHMIDNAKIKVQPPAIKVQPHKIRPDPERPKDVSELSSALKKELPELKFAGHTYSKDPFSRLIIANGKILREDQLIDLDLRLVEITPDGVILDFRGTVFSLKLE